MREIEFQEVGMENFGPYIEPMIHTFENDKVTLITGRNGVGKTMSLEALPFTFFGRTTKKDFKGDDAVNDVVGKNCKTWVKFKNNEDNFIVTRYQKYSGYGNTVIVRKNGVDILKGQREVLPFLEKIICPQQAFMNTLMFGQKVKDFFTDLVDSDKKEIFRKILNLMQYVLYYKETDENLKTVKANYTEVLNDINIKKEITKDTLQQIETLKSAKKDFFKVIQDEIKDLKQAISENERLLKSWEEKLKELQSNDLNVIDINNEITKIDIKLQSAKQKIQDGLIQLSQSKEIKISELTESANNEISKIKDTINEAIDILNQKNNGHNKILNDCVLIFTDKKHDIQNKIVMYEGQKNALESKIYEIEKRVINAEVSECPTCDQEVSDETKEKLVAKVKTYNDQILEINEIISKKIEERNECDSAKKKETDIINEKIREISSQIFELREQLTSKQEKIYQRLEFAKQKVDGIVEIEKQKIIENIKNESKELINERTSLSNKSSEMEKILLEIKKTETIISDIIKQNDSIENKIKFKEQQEYDETQLNMYKSKKIILSEDLTHLSEKALELDKQITILQFWKTAFSPNGIPSMLITDAIPFMNKKVTEYLDLLSNGRYIVSFDTQDEIKSGELRDKISVRVIDTQTRANSRVKLSGGQTRLIDIATILTLGDLFSNINDVKFNILIFDEIFDALDYDNVGYVCKILNKIKIGKSIWIISHTQQDQLEADEILTLT